MAVPLCIACSPICPEVAPLPEIRAAPKQRNWRSRSPRELRPPISSTNRNQVGAVLSLRGSRTRGNSETERAWQHALFRPGPRFVGLRLHLPWLLGRIWSAGLAVLELPCVSCHAVFFFLTRIGVPPVALVAEPRMDERAPDPGTYARPPGTAERERAHRYRTQRLNSSKTSLSYEARPAVRVE